MDTSPLDAETTVALSVTDAFGLFTSGLSDWWPRDFSWSGSGQLVDIGMEPRLGGALYEIGPRGLRWDWGLVTSWRPPTTVAFTWQIGPDRVPVPDPGVCTEVSAFFEPTPSRTRVRLSHTGWERPAGGAAYRAQFADVWPTALREFARHAR